jgi:hypothetical protein
MVAACKVLPYAIAANSYKEISNEYGEVVAKKFGLNTRFFSIRIANQ